MHDTGVMHEAGDVIRRQWRDPGGRLGKQKAREGSRNNGGNQEAGEGAAGGRGGGSRRQRRDAGGRGGMQKVWLDVLLGLGSHGPRSPCARPSVLSTFRLV